MIGSHKTRVHLHLDPETVAVLKSDSERFGLPVAQLIRLCLEQSYHLTKVPPKPAPIEVPPTSN
jgi:hypothetical protein